MPIARQELVFWTEEGDREEREKGRQGIHSILSGDYHEVNDENPIISLYQTPMQENNSLKLSQMSN